MPKVALPEYFDECVPVRSVRILATLLDHATTLRLHAPIRTAPNVVLPAHSGGQLRDNLVRIVGLWAGNIRTHAAGRAIDPVCLV